MYSTQSQLTEASSHEEIYLSHEIYIEPNPDPYRPGFLWTLCKNDEVLEEGLEFELNHALEAARSTVHNLDTEDRPAL